MPHLRSWVQFAKKSRRSERLFSIKGHKSPWSDLASAGWLSSLVSNNQIMAAVVGQIEPKENFVSVPT